MLCQIKSMAETKEGKKQTHSQQDQHKYTYKTDCVKILAVAE